MHLSSTNLEGYPFFAKMFLRFSTSSQRTWCVKRQHTFVSKKTFDLMCKVETLYDVVVGMVDLPPCIFLCDGHAQASHNIGAVLHPSHSYSMLYQNIDTKNEICEDESQNDKRFLLILYIYVYVS